jgi:hypothetical protein
MIKIVRYGFDSSSFGTQMNTDWHRLIIWVRLAADENNRLAVGNRVHYFFKSVYICENPCPEIA